MDRGSSFILQIIQTANSTECPNEGYPVFASNNANIGKWFPNFCSCCKMSLMEISDPFQISKEHARPRKFGPVKALLKVGATRTHT